MESSNRILMEDFEQVNRKRDVSFLRNKTVFVTGATGLIGSNLIRLLLYLNRVNQLNLRVVASVRSALKAERLFGSLLDRTELIIKEQDLTQMAEFTEHCDYIVHLAGITSSKEMSEHPVETIRTALSGTEEVLKLAAKMKVQKMVYASSMEVYGILDTDTPVSEEMQGYLNPLAVRSDYPLSKRMAENMCVAWHKEYGVSVVIARFAQVFGAGILPEESRVFAQFARSVIQKKDIVLHTDGSSEGNYCYLSDALTAILLLLEKGEAAEAYNVVNEKSHASIREMAEMCAKELAHEEIRVIYEIADSQNYGYAPKTRVHLSGQKLYALGFTPHYDLKQSYQRLLESMREE